MKKMMEEVQAQVSTPVFIWINVMSVVMLASVVFMFSHTVAMWVFFSAIGSLALAYVLFRKTRNIYVLGSVHLPLWIPLLVYIYRAEFAGGADFSQPYILWLTAASLVMIISLVFDIRDTAQVLFSGKGSTKA